MNGLIVDERTVVPSFPVELPLDADDPKNQRFVGLPAIKMLTLQHDVRGNRSVTVRRI